jgi:hypothetical protein
MNIDKKSWGNRRAAVNKAVSLWLHDPNVMFVDFGWRKRDNMRVEDEPCIRIHVKNKLPEGPALEMATQRGITRGIIPKEIDGFSVDVPQHVYRLHHGWWWGGGLPPVLNPGARKGVVDPMQGGISVSDNKRNIAGTLGGLVADRETGDPMILSNFHVLAGVWSVQPGWPTYQPGQGDGGTEANTVARFERHAMESSLDAAVAKLTGDRPLVNKQFGLDPAVVNGVAWAQLGMEVVKSGRTSGVTRGRVIGVEGSLKMTYDGVSRVIRNVMEIEPREGRTVSEPGDSGSFWLDEETMCAVGLHFAGGDYPERALAMDMQPVLDALKIDLP